MPTLSPDVLYCEAFIPRGKLETEAYGMGFERYGRDREMISG